VIKDPLKNTPKSPSIGIASRAGIELVSGIFVGVLFGYFIDYTFHSKPWGMLVMILLGAAAGFRNIFRLVQSDSKLTSVSSKKKGHHHD
jgi:ATP synthase protein I